MQLDLAEGILRERVCIDVEMLKGGTFEKEHFTRAIREPIKVGVELVTTHLIGCPFTGNTILGYYVWSQWRMFM